MRRHALGQPAGAAPPPAPEVHRMDAQALCARLQTTSAGLSGLEARRRLARYGPNVLAAPRRTPELVKLLRHFAHPFALLLLLGAGLAGLAEGLRPGEGNGYIAAALVTVVLLNGGFGYLQTRQGERIMAGFQRLLPDAVAVLRDGRAQRVPAAELVPGDVMLLSEGERIPADGRLIEQAAMAVDHSALTGESAPALRSLEATHARGLESRNLVFSGTFVRAGHGKAVVHATGMDTEFGRVVRLTKHTAAADTPLRRELEHFIRVISLIAVGLGVLFFVLSTAVGNPLLTSLIFAIGIIVANVPEGLLPTVTLALAMASKRMARKQALIKHLESVETLGCTTVICTDKTGTLTQNRMSVVGLALDGAVRDADDPALARDAGLARLCAAAALCNNADPAPAPGSRGDPTEVALLDYARRRLDLPALLAAQPRLDELPFDSTRKRMVTAHRGPAAAPVLYLKGAPEAVLPLCSHAAAGGDTVALTPERLAAWRAAYRQLAGRGQRVLALAGRAGGDVHAEAGYTLLGLAGIADPLRPEAAEALRRCRAAGIRVIMITGDGSLTAAAVARQVGLFAGAGKVVTGEELSGLSEARLEALLRAPELAFSRTTPDQKLRIVKALRRLGEVVTVTGDGVNDAPALKHADMGVAMGLAGTEVARESARMVLLDDNFATVVNAVEEGRAVYDNIRKFVAYILTSNVPEILPFIAYVLLGLPLPLSIVLVLAIDLGTDMLPAIALGQERPERDVMRRPPRDRHERLLTPALLRRAYGLMGGLEAAAGFFAYFAVLERGGWDWGEGLGTADPLYRTAVSAFFAAVVVCQVANALVSRARRESVFSLGLLSNRPLLAGIALELLLMLAIVYLPPLQAVFGTAALAGWQLLLGLPVALLMFGGDELRKRLPRAARLEW